MEPENFVGRKSYLDLFRQTIGSLEKREDSSFPLFITVKGEKIDKEDKGGIGKTKLLMKFKDIAQDEYQLIVTDVIDLKATSNRSSISLLTSIANSVDGSQHFDKFYKELIAYNSAKEQEKVVSYEMVINAFKDCVIEKSNETPIVIILDTFESIQDLDFGKWMLELLIQLGKRVCVVIAGRRLIPLSDVQVIQISLAGLEREEIELLGRNLFASRGVGDFFDLSDEILVRIKNLTDGRPILVVLAFEWILEKVEPDSIISIPKELFEAEIVGYLRKLTSEEDMIIAIMATIDRRLNFEIVSLLTSWEIEKCKTICNRISRFSFVKIIDRANDEDEILTLHDEMLRLVSSYADFSPDVKENWRRNVVQLYYDKKIEVEVNPQLIQTFIAEKLYYLLQYEVGTAIHFFDKEIQIAISDYEFDFANLLLSEVRKFENTLDNRSRNIVDLCKAEFLVKAYQPFEAKTLFDQLITCFDVEVDTSYFSRVLSGLGLCIAQGSTVSEDRLNEAISLLRESLDLCQAKKLTDRIATILYELSYCYDLMGYNDETLSYLLESNKQARETGNNRLITTTLDEIGKLRLRRYEVPQAMDLFIESLEIKKQGHDLKGMAMSYHQIGNAYRDLGSGNFQEALRWYEMAEQARKQVSDDLGLCELYSDIGWLYLLEKDWAKTEYYLKKQYYEYALPRNFGREIADAEHSMYHLKLETEGIESAMPWIEKSFEHAKMYSNVFIYLDATLHLIERAYELKDFTKINDLYEKMDELDRKGCGYRMFKGRATNILGDIEFDNKNYNAALDKWQDGYAIVAIHGRSRSATTTFDDYLQSRYVNITKALISAGENCSVQFLDKWHTALLDDGPLTLADEYPGMVGVVTNAIGDIYYEMGDYKKAVFLWVKGLLEIVSHICYKTRSQALRLAEHMEMRESSISIATKALQSQEKEDVLKMLNEYSQKRSSDDCIQTVNLLVNEIREFFGARN